KYAKSMVTTDGRTGDPAPLLAVSSDGKMVVSGHIRQVRCWDVEQGKELSLFRVDSHSISTLSLSPDGKTLATASMGDGGVRLWEIPTGKPVLPYDAPRSQLQGVVISADGKLIASGGYDDDIRTWDALTGAELRRFPSKGRSALTADGATLVGGGWNDGFI